MTCQIMLKIKYFIRIIFESEHIPNFENVMVTTQRNKFMKKSLLNVHDVTNVTVNISKSRLAGFCSVAPSGNVNPSVQLFLQ